MILRQALGHARKHLTTHDIEYASLESEILLRHTLGTNQVQLYQNLNSDLSPEQEKIFWELVNRRIKGEPTAYITEHREFFGLDFFVDSDVLIPRPESELLVEKALSLAQHRPITIVAEIGTGCGAIAIALAVNLPQITIYAIDISAPALKVARINCERHGITNRVHILQGDLLDPLPESVDLIIANLPYIEAEELPQPNFEPRLALDGGTGGLEKINDLCRQVNTKLHLDGYMLLEIGQGQAEAVTALLYKLYPSAKVEITPDLSGIKRVVSMFKTSRPSPPPSPR